MRSVLPLVLLALGALCAPAPGARAETVVLYSPQGATTPADQGFGLRFFGIEPLGIPE